MDNSGNLSLLIARFYTGPPPSAPTCSIPEIPFANTLAQRIVSSTEKLFFISLRIGGSINNIRKWWLIPVALTMSMSSYPSCLEDGKYVIDFYMVHPSNFRFSAINQRFWLQYHSQDNLMGPCSSLDTHLIHPSDTSEAYAKHHKLLPFHRFLNLTHLDTYIHGPFNFATIHGQKIHC